ncbi:MAG: ATP-binding protein [Phycisphaerales bacterium]
MNSEHEKADSAGPASVHGLRPPRLTPPDASPRGAIHLACIGVSGQGRGTLESLITAIPPEVGEAFVTDAATLDRAAFLDRVEALLSRVGRPHEHPPATPIEPPPAHEQSPPADEAAAASRQEPRPGAGEPPSPPGSPNPTLTDPGDRPSELATIAAEPHDLLRHINVGVLILDADLRVRTFTPAITQVVSLAEHDVGRSIEHSVASLGPHFIADARRVLATGQATERETRSARGNWLLVRILPHLTHANQPSGVVATFLDITPIKNANEMTRTVNHQLAHANTALSSQQEELEDMFSIVAHDLKRPVLAIDGLLSLIEGMEQAGASASPAPRDPAHPGDMEILRRTIAECKRMKQMLVDLEGISGIQQRPIVYETVAVPQWLDDVVARFTEPARLRGVLLHRESTPGSVNIARSFVEEILVNLLENAMKYGSSNPSPRISVSARVCGEFFEVTVSDNGKGIPREQHQKIFEPFRRLEPHVAPGSGIGLLAVKRLVHRLGGHITLDSEPGRGATFTVRVRLASDSREPAGSSKSLQVLLVEDDLLDARTVERCLRDSCRVTRAQSISEAQRRLSLEAFDVVLLDLSLPDGHGLALVNHMRTVARIRTPVVIITGHGEGLSPSVMDAMIGAYISKSELNQQRLLSAIHQALSSPKLSHSVLG